MLKATVAPDDPEEFTAPHAVEYVNVAPDDKLKLVGKE